MGFSIFSSKQTWSSARTKELVRTDVETEQQVHFQIEQLRRQGHDITDVLPNTTDRPSPQGRRSRR